VPAAAPQYGGRPAVRPCLVGASLGSFEARVYRLPLQLIAATVAWRRARVPLGHRALLEMPPPVGRLKWADAAESLHLNEKTIGQVTRIHYRSRDDSRGTAEGARCRHAQIVTDDFLRVDFKQLLYGEKFDSVTAALPATVARLSVSGSDHSQSAERHPRLLPKACVRRIVPRSGTRDSPYSAIPPRTNGKAERFPQTRPRECTHARTYNRSNLSDTYLPSWLRNYARHLPDAWLASQPSIFKPDFRRFNLLRAHSLYAQ
jgi:hypothetical protein